MAPDYVLCDVRIRDRLVGAIRAEISRQFGADPLQNPDYGKIINEKHFHRLLGLMDAEKIVCHEFRVGHSLTADSGVDTLNPQAAELTFFVFAVSVRIGETFFYGVFGDRPYISP